MSDSMETGGFGKSPAIDRINQRGAAGSRGSAVSELQRRVFRPAPDRRKEISDQFQISFKKGGKQEDETILHGGKRRLLTGRDSVYSREPGQDRFTVRTPRRVLPDGGGQAAQVLPVEREAGYDSGEWRRRTDNRTVIQPENRTRPDTSRSGGDAPADKGDVSQIQSVTSLPVQGREYPGGLVPDGNGRYGDRTYQSPRRGKGVDGTADIHVSGPGIHKVEEYHTI